MTRKRPAARRPASPSASRRLPDDLARRVADLEDHPRRDVDAAVGERAVGRGRGRAAGPRPCRARRPGRPAGTASCRPGSGCPSFVARSATASLPTRWSARIAGMLSEYWSALRTRTGPRSSWSASRGVQPRAVELGRDVEQQAARRQTLRVERAGVEDRLEGRARLARRRRRRRRTWARTCGSPGRRGSSRRCRRRPGRRRSGSRARRARRCGGPCRAGR